VTKLAVVAALLSLFPPVVVLILSWRGNVDMLSQLAAPEDKICSGDPVCIAEIVGEQHVDFLLTIFLFAPLIFLSSLAVSTAVLFFGAYFSEYRPWRTHA
jgi:hypothetical protein